MTRVTPSLLVRARRLVPGVWLGLTLLALVALGGGQAAVFQSSTLAWPVPIPPAGTETAGWHAGGWRVSSPFGWRQVPGPAPEETVRWEFHDGIDLQGPSFCAGCPVPAAVDGVVSYVGWDQPAADRPDTAGAGLVVQLDNGPAASGYGTPELRISYGHLQPYLLHVELQGRVREPWHEPPGSEPPYAALGSAELPVADPVFELACDSSQVVFVPQSVAPGRLSFAYDRPVRCSASLVWPTLGGGWRGWRATEPLAGPIGRAVLQWATPVTPGASAGDVALRFRAELEPPPPPPTPVPTPTATAQPAFSSTARQKQRTPPFSSSAVDAGTAGCEAAAAGSACRWRVSELLAAPSTPALPRLSQSVAVPASLAATSRLVDTSATADCAYVGTVAISAQAPTPALHPEAAAAFEQARAELHARSGVDALSSLADVLRRPSYQTNKPGVAFRSWHKAGRAIDLDQGAGWTVRPEGDRFRVWLGAVDVTALLEAHGWSRIPAQGSVAEWWHYEFRTPRLSWAGAMQQIWPQAQLAAELPEFAWPAAGCASDEPAAPAAPQPSHELPVCHPGVPTWRSPVEYLAGCGPPVRLNAAMRMLDSTIGVVGLTGRTTGAHLHLRLQQRRAATGSFAATDVCTPLWLPPALSYDQVVADGGSCWTLAVDPLEFLPRAHGGPPLPQATAAPAMDEPLQLPPPGSPGALLLPAASGAAPGEYWSPHADGGRFGGGSLLSWLLDLWCALLRWWGSSCGL